MKSVSLVLAAVVALVVTASAPSSTRDSGSAALLRLPRAAAAGEISQYGHIRSLAKKGARYELLFDPAFWLGGVTANRAAAEDGLIAPGEPVPNDYYVRDESKKRLTYLVPAGATVTVLDRRIRSFRITVAQLAQVVKGRNPTGRGLYDRTNGLGYWIVAASDTVRALDQQYQP
ncbi:MAG TPA: hypothetical protein VI540_10265 [Gaiellaceae bacterium]|nr:hypothetical protein [Gaiellaceae bacterium]